MTNGEKLKEIFPNITERFTNTDEYTNKPTRVEISVGMHILTTISVDVWNAEYVEPRKGHWICDRANVRCSCCGKGYKDFYGKARIASYNYCPNCGAKMVEPQESEDKG